jgi:hypothetical protein
MLERQRETLGDLVKRREGLKEQLENASLLLQSMRLDLLALGSAGVQSAINDATSATQEARALSRDLRIALDAAKQIRSGAERRPGTGSELGSQRSPPIPHPTTAPPSPPTRSPSGTPPMKSLAVGFTSGMAPRPKSTPPTSAPNIAPFHIVPLTVRPPLTSSASIVDRRIVTSRYWSTSTGPDSMPNTVRTSPVSSTITDPSIVWMRPTYLSSRSSGAKTRTRLPTSGPRAESTWACAPALATIASDDAMAMPILLV